MLGHVRYTWSIQRLPVACRGLCHARDNVVEFLLHDLSGVNFYLHDSKVTKGQKFSAVHHHGQHGLKVRAACHESKDVALWFNDKTIHGAAFGLRVMDQVRHPTKMNFAVWGNIEFTIDTEVYAIENLVLGQATDNGSNWWVGGSGPNFTRVMVYDQVGHHPALMVKSPSADIMFAPCKSGIENCFGVTIFKR